MIPSIQQMQDRFPDWDMACIAAYRRGVSWFDVGAEIVTVEQVKQYNPCLLRGYADAMGPDAEYTDWFDVIEDDWFIDERWWE